MNSTENYDKCLSKLWNKPVTLQLSWRIETEKTLKLHWSVVEEQFCSCVFALFCVGFFVVVFNGILAFLTWMWYLIFSWFYFSLFGRSDFESFAASRPLHFVFSLHQYGDLLSSWDFFLSLATVNEPTPLVSDCSTCGSISFVISGYRTRDGM